MDTEVIKIINTNTLKSAVSKAGELLLAGEIVALPTETVYGLAADAFNADAVGKIFTAKQRPADNPLIVHIDSINQLDDIATDVPNEAKVLIDKFWPGPLSFVFKKNPKLPEITTAGLDTVVVRMVKHEVAKAVIRHINRPIAAPSANTSGKVSPTKAEYVYDDLSGKIPLIIDAGETEFGLESTVIDCTSEPFSILRPGSVTIEMIQELYPKITHYQKQNKIKSPGMKYRHYSPTTPLILFTGPPTETIKKINKYAEKNPSNTSVLYHTGTLSAEIKSIKIPYASESAAPLIFAALRELDKQNQKVILVQGFETTHVGIAIMNRLEKAATEIIK